jgi:LacI family transcriptional regulator
MGNREINSEEIARRVGVSRSTVSKVLNDYPSISEATRQRVWAAVEEFGYYPDISARIMAGKRSDTIALFLAGSGSFSGDILVDLMIASMIESAADAGYHILTYIIGDPHTRESERSIKEVFFQRRVDAGVFVGFPNDFAVVDCLVSEGFVVGVFDQSARGTVYPNRVVANFDDERVAGQAIDYLVGMGHREIAVINGDTSRNAGKGRCTGFSGALARHSIRPPDAWVRYSDFSQSDGRRLATELLSSSNSRPTAIAAVNDSVAFGVIEALREAGVAVPGELSVIGIDGHPLCSYVTPGLTTFAYDFREMFRSLIRSVTEIVEGSEPRHQLHQVFSGVFTERESCAPPAE